MSAVERVVVTLGGVGRLEVVGPAGRLAAWLSDPDLPQTVPGFSLGETAGGADVSLVFQEAAARRCATGGQGTVLQIAGDLASLSRRDFRRLLMHAAKAAVERRGGALVHAACVLAPQGQRILIGGSSGGGKTTLSLLLAGRGCRLLATDVTLLDEHCQVCAGTSHLTVYPQVLAACRPDLAEALPPGMAGAGSRSTGKISLPRAMLEKELLPSPFPTLQPVERVVRVALDVGANSWARYQLDDQERLAESLILSESWARSVWICPTWEMFLPSLDDEIIRARRWELAKKLARRPHERLTGSFAGAVEALTSLGQQIPAGSTPSERGISTGHGGAIG